MRFLRIAFIVILCMGFFMPLQVKAENTLVLPKTVNPHWHTNPAIYGDRIVWEALSLMKGNWDIYMYDLTKQETTQITTDPSNQRYPAIYGDKIVWQDKRNGNWDIYLYDLANHEEVQITTDESDQTHPAIYGDKIVWQDNRNGNWDIYLYDLAKHKEIQITTDESNQTYPAIYGDKIVWEDSRNDQSDIYLYDLTKQNTAQITVNSNSEGPYSVYEDKIVYRRSGKNGFGSYIYLYDLTKRMETRITSDLPSTKHLHLSVYPAIFDDKITWEDNGEGDNKAIYLYDLTKQETIRINQDQGDHDQFSPAIYGDFVVWEDYRNGSPDIYLYDLAKKTETRITNDDSSSLSSNIEGNQSGIELVVNGRSVGTQVSPRIIGGRVMVPIRVVSETLGAHVRWDEKNNTIYMTTDENKEMPGPEVPNSSREIQLVMNGQLIKSDVPPKMVNGTTLVPIRTVAQILGANVAWDPAHQRVTVVSLGILLKNTAYYIENYLNWIDMLGIHSKTGDGDWITERFRQVSYSRYAVEQNYEAFKTVFGKDIKNNQDLQMIDAFYQEAVRNMDYHTVVIGIAFDNPNAGETLEKLAQSFSTYELD